MSSSPMRRFRPWRPRRPRRAGRGASFRRAACTTAEEVAEAVRGARVAVVQFAPLSREAVAGLAPGATAIRYGVGYDNFDLAALKEHGVKAAYVPDYCTEEVADHTAAMALALLRRLPQLDASVRRGEWAAVKVSKPLKPFAKTDRGLPRLRPGSPRCPQSPRPSGSDPRPRPWQEGQARGHPPPFVDLPRSSPIRPPSLHAPSTRRHAAVIGRQRARQDAAPCGVLVNSPAATHRR
jgi:hypothetical protein